MCFEDLRLIEPLLRAVRTAGYRTPTPIQSSAIPHVLAGRDVLGCAQTGTGKTAAFALPILQRLSTPASTPHPRSAAAAGGSPPRALPASRIRALVLCPTRELAQQIHDSFQTYGQHTGLRQTAVYGGVNQNPQARALKAGVDVLIATPGRLLDLMGQRLVSLAGVEILVLDEADRMLDMGFIPDIRRILAHVPRQRQTLLFSATLPTTISELAKDILRNPLPVQVARVSSAPPTVAHWVYHVEQPEKPKLLTRLLARAPRARALVFTRTKHGADKLTRHLLRAGVRAAALHGNKSQGARTRALAEFRSAQTPVLVATDLAARGLDVDDIAQVFNYDLTPDPETYVHRIGRTGRAGAAGTAVSFCSTPERPNLRGIERLLRSALQTAVVPREDSQQRRNLPA
jgi:ATP-dependent RNA helicase RhlE